jgi:Ca-activated chloride channel family protein
VRFLNPSWLWVAAAMIPTYWVFVHDERRRWARFAEFADQAVWGRIAPEIDPGARLRKSRAWLAALAFAFIALARPQWGSHEETVKVNGLDIMIALDVSNSMDVEDVVPSRLKKARHLVKSLLDRLGGDRVGVAAFAASSYVACPLTTDLNYVLDQMQVLGPKMVQNQGTDIGLGLDTARAALERGAEENLAQGARAADQASGSNASHAVLLISDGEDQEGRAVESAKALRDQGIKLYVIGVGTQKGGPIPVRDDAGNLGSYKKDRSGQPIVSTFRPDDLMSIAAAAGGRYWNASVDEVEIDDILKDLGALNRSDYGERRFVVYEDRFQYPLAVAVFFLLLELVFPARKLKLEAVAPLLLLCALSSREAAAGTFFGPQPPVEAYLDNRKGIQAFKDGKVDEAKKSFGAAQARDPSLPELQFNQGLVQMSQGEVDSAIQAFGSAAQGALGLGEGGASQANPDVAGKSFFNLGSALTKKGDIKGAVRSYLGAIDQAQRAGDGELEADARKNLQLLISKRQQQQQQQQKQDQQQKQQQDQQKQDQKKDGEGKDQKKDEQKDQAENEKNKDKPKEYKDTSKDRQKEFRSMKLSKDDADRVMAELSNKEKDLYAKLHKQRGNPTTNQKDW